MKATPGPDDGGDEPMFAEINITPLTDVFLVLLIIFMLFASATVEQQAASASAEYEKLDERALEVTTPQGAGQSQIIRKDLVISILPDGQVFIDDVAVPMADIAGVLAKKRQDGTAFSKRAVIRGDQSSNYALVMQVVTAADQAGFTELALATRGQ